MRKKQERLIKSTERVKKFGEVFTPPKLVSDMLDKLPADVWLPGKTFFEPACGNGNFLVQVLERKLAAGHDVYDAVSTIYAVDIQSDNVTESIHRMLQVLESSRREFDYEMVLLMLVKNIRVGDALKLNIGKFFLTFPDDMIDRLRQLQAFNLKCETNNTNGV